MKDKALLLLFVALVSACDKPVDPVDPITGEWVIHRIVYSGFKKPFDSYNRVDSLPGQIGTDRYVFNSNHTYSEQYSGYHYRNLDSLVTSKGVENGTWVLTDTKPIPTLSLKSGSSATTVEFRTNELSMTSYGSFYLSDSQFHKYFAGVPGYPTPVTYTQEIIYRRAK